MSKTTVQITVTQNLCDTCEKPVVFSGQFCIVCGKHKCQLCDDLVFLDFEGPKYLMLAGYAPDVPRCRACPDCKNEITRGMKKLKEYVALWENDREFHASRYNNLAERIAALIEKRERQIDG